MLASTTNTKYARKTSGDAFEQAHNFRASSMGLWWPAIGAILKTQGRNHQSALLHRVDPFQEFEDSRVYFGGALLLHPVARVGIQRHAAKARHGSRHARFEALLGRAADHRIARARQEQHGGRDG